MNLCCCWEGPEALIYLAENEGEGLLVELGVLTELTNRSGIVDSAGLLPDKGAHHTVPPSQASVLPAGRQRNEPSHTHSHIPKQRLSG